jgi:hypothetical protein
LLLAAEGGLQAVLDEALADPLDGGRANFDGVGDALVGPARAAGGGIGLEQDTGMGEFASGGLAGGDQVFGAVGVPRR